MSMMKFMFLIVSLFPMAMFSFTIHTTLPRSNTALSVFRLLNVPPDIKVRTFAQLSKNKSFGLPMVGKFRLVSKIPAEAMEKNMEDYIKQMVKQAGGRTVYNGYRNGQIPPHALKDVAGVLIPFGLEKILIALWNANGLEPCGENKEPVMTGESAYYDSIIMPNKMGFGYEDQKAIWQRGTAFPFTAEFYAIMHGHDLADKKLQTEV